MTDSAIRKAKISLKKMEKQYENNLRLEGYLTAILEITRKLHSAKQSLGKKGMLDILDILETKRSRKTEKGGW